MLIVQAIITDIAIIAQEGFQVKGHIGICRPKSSLAVPAGKPAFQQVYKGVIKSALDTL